jgi:hypothetical protein
VNRVSPALGIRCWGVTLREHWYTGIPLPVLGKIRKRKKAASKEFRGSFGHTPLSVEEDIPWNCSRLVVGTGTYGSLPVMEEVKREAKRRKVELLVVPTPQAIEALKHEAEETNAILHVTC